VGAALILYGSRARGETRPGADVDLILAEEGDSINSPQDAFGVSVHSYSKGWLEAEAAKGSLFVYHVAFEGFALYDNTEFLVRLRSSFRKKASYLEDKAQATLILRMLLEKDWRDNHQARRRYFWAIRTILICGSAELGTPAFASAALEDLSGIGGLAAHIDSRSYASFADCRLIGNEVLTKFGLDSDPALQGVRLRDHLMALGGIAWNSVRIVEEPEAIELGSGLIYL
jgi:hypothetical protein